MQFSEMKKINREFYETHLLDEEPDWELEPDENEDPDDDTDDTEPGVTRKGDIQRRLDMGIALAEPDKSRE